MKKWLLLSLLFITKYSFSLEVHSVHCLKGCPFGSPSTNDLLIRDIYILSSNDQTKFADWTAYKVYYKNFGKSPKRVWIPDPWLSSNETLEPEDYRGAHKKIGYDRGHQVPLGSFSGTKFWSQTNYLSNITPQKSDLNQGPWRELEESVRRLSKRNKKEVYVMTGPIYDKSSSFVSSVKPLPSSDESHNIPTHYWKIVSLDLNKGIKTAAFILPQTANKGDSFCRFPVKIEEVEKKTGLKFFHNLSLNEQKILKTTDGKLYSQLECSKGQKKKFKNR